MLKIEDNLKPLKATKLKGSYKVAIIDKTLASFKL